MNISKPYSIIHGVITYNCTVPTKKLSVDRIQPVESQVKNLSSTGWKPWLGLPKFILNRLETLVGFTKIYWILGQGA